MEHEDNNTQFDNYLRGNFDEFSLQHNQQNLVENLQNASGFGAGGIVGVVDEIGSVGGGVCIGGKFDEEEHDEEEWKYIQEVQQSEKQQHKQQKMLKVGEEIGDGVGGLDDYNEDEGRDEQILLPTSEYEEEELAIIKNDGDFSTTSNTTSTTVGEEENSAAAEVDEEPQKLKAMDGDDIAAPLWSQVKEVEKEVAKDLPGNEKNSPEIVVESSLATGENSENLPQQQQLFDEQHETLAEKIENYMFSSSPPLFAGASNISDEEEQKYEADKENADPVIAATAAVLDPLEGMVYAAVSRTEPEPQSVRPSELDLEMHSNLNPDAKEFVPIYSNPTSPISPVKTNDINFSVGSAEERPIQSDSSPVVGFGVGDKNDIHDDFGNNDSKTENDIDDSLMGDDVGEPALSASSVSPHPNAVPRHLIGTDAVADDVVAQSPRKGRGLDMDEISLPAVNDFELEANERPHEIEQEEVVVAGDGDMAGNARNEADNTDAENKQMENGENMHRGAGDADIDFEDIEHQMEMSPSKDYTDFKHPLDHGPETSVDLDMDSQDVMKQSFYIENSAVNSMNSHEEEEELQGKGVKQPIEELLNTVQPIPTDSESINNSFDDLIDVPSKEMLNVEEKEVISHSPSTEEIQMQFQSEIDASSKDVSAIPIDLDSIGHMQESFYMEHTQNQHSMEIEMETATETSHEFRNETQETESEVEQNPVATGEHVSLPTLKEPYPTDILIQHETTESIKENNEFLTESKQAEICTSPVPTEKQFTDFHQEKEAKELVTPSSPYSTEEKHLMEETKEYQHLNLDNGINKLEQKMDDLVLEHDSNLQKVDDVAQVATTINKEEIAFFVQESEIIQPQLHEELLFEENKIKASSPSPLLGEEDHHNYHQNHNEDVTAQFETHNEPNESQLQVKEVSSSMQEIIFPVDTSSITYADPFVKDHEASLISEDVPAPAPVNDILPTTDETALLQQSDATASLLHSDATASLQQSDATPVLLHSDVAASLLQSDATVSVPGDSVAGVTTEEAAAAIVATAATAVTVAAVAAAASSTEKPIEPVKKASVVKTSSSTTTTKSKASTNVDVKKSIENKKPATTATKTTTLAANTRPRTAPSTSATKNATAGSSEKKTTATSAKSVTQTMSARKPLTNNVTAAKPATKSSTARPTTLVSSTKTTATGATTAKNSVTAKTLAPRPATATSASRKPLTTSTATAQTPSATTKPRPLTVGAAPKPSTLNITNKPKAALSPRSTVTSQLRKTGGAGPTSVASTAKSPIKTATTPTTNGSAKPSQTASSSLTNRTKTTTTTTTTTTKTFTARPAPKTTSTLTTTSTLNATSRRATTGSATKTSSNLIQRKSSPSKPSTVALGGKVSPTKTNAISKNKTKDVTTPKSVGKTAAGAKEVHADLKGKPLVAAEELVDQPKLNGNSCSVTGEPLEHTENGGIHDHHTHEENGSIEQGEMALMDATAA